MTSLQNLSTILDSFEVWRDQVNAEIMDCTKAIRAAQSKLTPEQNKLMFGESISSK